MIVRSTIFFFTTTFRVVVEVPEKTPPSPRFPSRAERATMASADDVQIGDLVNVPGGMHGTVKYLGAVAGKPGKFAGIELALEHAKRGKNNGEVDGRKYFSTSTPGSGIFVPMNNSKYVTRRFAASTMSATPSTPARPPVNFSKSVGPGTAPRSAVRRPSQAQARPESPQRQTPSKLSVRGLRTPSGPARTSMPSNGSTNRSPVKAPSRMSERPSSRFSTEGGRGDLPSARTSDYPLPRASTSGEVQELKDNVKNLEKQLQERDKQLEEQAATFADFQKTLEDMEGSDVISVRNQLREKNERIAQLTSEFDLHRADFRSTLDTLEIAATETERVYEQRVEELLQQNREMQDRGEDVEAVARQLKQLEELVSELEEGLEDARRGEAEARAEVEFLRGEVERTQLELQKERGGTSSTSSGSPTPSKGFDQKDDEIRGLKAIIHSLSRGDPNLSALKLNGASGGSQHADAEHVAELEQRLQEFEELTDKRGDRIEELERELQQLQTNSGNSSRNRSSTVTASQNQQKPAGGSAGNPPGAKHAHRLSDRTVVPNDWQDNPEETPYSHQRGTSGSSRLETMHESDTQSDDGSNANPWCEICETHGHDILSCTSMFGAEGNNKSQQPQKGQSSDNDESAGNDTDTPGSSGDDEHVSNSAGSHGDSSGPHKAALEGLKGANGASSTNLPAVAGKDSGVVDETKWCALCERDGHESIDCPFDD